MEARTMGIDLTPEESSRCSGTRTPNSNADEAEARWGGTEAYAESQRRAASYTKEDWKRVQRGRRLAGAVHRPGGRRRAAVRRGAMDLAEEHRRHIGTWYFEVPYEMHRCSRRCTSPTSASRRTTDSLRPGLAELLMEAILANAARHAS
ncbi:hypothetical protein GCM10023238_05660 [Streptomyces heliomycini]